MKNILVENAKVMAKGQITLPKDIRDALGVTTGDRVTLIRQDNQVIMMNAAVYAMKLLQTSMTGEAEKAGLRSDEDVTALVMEMRSEKKKLMRCMIDTNILISTALFPDSVPVHAFMKAVMPPHNNH